MSSSVTNESLAETIRRWINQSIAREQYRFEGPDDVIQQLRMKTLHIGLKDLERSLSKG
jgi:hypothetical protein